MGDKKMILRTKRLQLKDSIKKAYMKRMISICLIVSLIIGFSLDLNVFAEDKNDFSKYVTSMNFYDGDNNEISDGSTISTSDKIKAEYNFTISSSDISNGNLILELPEELEVEKSNIEVESDGYIGTASNEKNKTIISLMENSQYDTTVDEVTTSDGVTVNEDKKIKGKLKLEMGFNAEKLEGLTSKIVRLTEDGLEFENSNLMKQQALLDATVNFPFITGVYLSDKEFKGDLALNEDKFAENYDKYIKDGALNTDFDRDTQTMYIGYKFEIPNDKNVHKGDSFELKIPSIFLAQDDTIELKYDGKVLANVQCTKADSKLRIVFTDAVEGLSDISGSFYIGRKFDKEKIGYDDSKDVKFDVPLRTDLDIKYTLNFKPLSEVPASINKTGNYSKDTQLIDWTITADPGNKKRENFVVKDTNLIGNKQHTFNSGSLKVNNTSRPDLETQFSTDGAISLGNISPGEVQTIKFQTKPAQDIIINQEKNGIDITNDVVLDINDSEMDKASSKVNIKNNYISKTGNYRPLDKKIDWTITVNTSNINFTKDAVITDTLPDGLEFNESNGDKVTIDGVDISDFIYDDINSPAKLTIKTPMGIEQHTIKFSTTITSDALKEAFLTGNKKFDNKAELATEVNSNLLNVKSETTISIGGQGKGEAISKTIKKQYNNKTREIEWEINVNNINLIINNPKVIETIGEDQEYVTGTAKLDGSTITPTINGKTLTFDIGTLTGGSINGPHKITLTTKVTDLKKIYNNTYMDIYNSCKLEGTNIQDYGDTVKTGTIINTLITKSSDYDYASREITWKLKINEAKMPIKGASIIDNIPKGQEYVKGSFEIKDSSGNVDNTIESTAEYVSSSDPDKAGTLTYKFGDDNKEITDNYTITFRTKMASDSEFYENEDKKITNTARIKIPEAENANININGSITQIVPNYILKKESYHTNNNDYITWAISLNKNKVKLHDAVVTDIIPDGLQIDMDTVKVYKGSSTDEGDFNLDSTGAFVGTSPDEFNDYTASYSAADRKLTITFQNEIDNSYLIKFETVANESGLEISNSATLEAKESQNGIPYTGSSKKFNMSFTNTSGGDITGKTATLILTKTNGCTPSRPLEGAVFELSKDGVVVEVSNPTGADGQAIFKRLKFGNKYSIKELTAPIGYAPDNTEHTFTISKKDFPSETTIFIKKQDFQNNLIKKDIKLIKKSSDGNPIKGAEFTLYLPDGAKGTAVSDENGVVLFKDIAVDPSKSVNYVIKETKIPTGYVTYTGDITATITPDGNNGDVVNATPYEVVNKFIQKNIKLLKTSEDGVKLKDATFTLYKKGNETTPLVSVKSDENGIVEFKDVDYGDYVIKETMAPNGFDPSVDSITVNKTDFETADAFFDKGIVVNTKTKPQKIIEIYKEADNGTTLKDAIFSIYKDTDTNFENPLFTTVSDANGLVRFTNIKAGDYKIKETKAPKGYELSDTVISIKESDFEVAGEVIKTNPYKIVNKEIIKTIELYKQDINGNPLKDAIFSLYKLEDVNFENPISSAVSDDNGIVKFINVKAGNYKIKETKAPEGYKLSEEVINITIDEFNGTDDVIRTSPYEFINKLIPTNGGGSGGGGGSSSSSKKHKDDKDEEEIITTDPEEKTEIDNNTKVEQENNQNTGNNFLNATEGSPSGSQYTLYDKNGNEISAGVDTNGTNGTNYTSGEEKIKAKSKKEKLPQAGRFIDSTVLIISGLILIILGFAYNLKRKKSVKF